MQPILAPRLDRPRHLQQVRRLVGIAAAPSRRRFREAIEGVQRGDRGLDGWPPSGATRVGQRGCGSTSTRSGAAPNEARRSTVSKTPARAASAGAKARPENPRHDDGRRPVQHFGGRERFGVNRRGFLELERGLGG